MPTPPPATNAAQSCLFISKSCLLKKVLIWVRKNILMRVFAFFYVLQRSETSSRSKFRRSLAAPNGKTAKIVPSGPAREKKGGIKVRGGNCETANRRPSLFCGSGHFLCWNSAWDPSEAVLGCSRETQRQERKRPSLPVPCVAIDLQALIQAQH